MDTQFPLELYKRIQCYRKSDINNEKKKKERKKIDIGTLQRIHSFVGRRVGSYKKKSI